jgi:hypothetical protein
MRQNGETSPPPDGVASLATAAPHQTYVTAVRKGIEGLLAVCTESKEDLLGENPAPEDQELSREELFRKRLEEKLGQLRQTLAGAPAAAPAPSPPPAAAP